MDYPINDAGIGLLKSFESFAQTFPKDPDLAHAYWDDMGKVWTIGWGFTKGVKSGDTMTRDAADARLAHELNIEYVQFILNACTTAPNENQLAAMACLAWNIGMGWDPTKPKPKDAKDGFRQSTVLKAHNRGDLDSAARAFGLWNKSGGKVVRGLTRRRAAEAELYLTPTRGEATPMPQKVDPEGSLTRSPIVAGSTVTAATTTLAVVAESSAQVKTIKDNLGDWLPFVVGAVAIGGAVWAIYARWVQRKGGWA